MTRTLNQASFNGGELSARMEGRSDLQAYGVSGREILNMVLTVQGPAVKRPGTIFVEKTEGAARLIPFVYNATQGYVIEAGDGFLRFYTNDARIDAGGLPYQLESPWNADAIARLDWQQSGDVLYLVDGERQPMILKRTSAETFALEHLAFRNGPFADQNGDRASTVIASASDGAVTITASQPIFAAGHVGALFEMEAPDFHLVPAWEPNVEIAIGDRRRSDGKVYQAIALPASGSKRTGTERPIHTEGRERDGSSTGKDYNDEDVGGVLWEYLYARAGMARITAVLSATVATATVEKRLPDEIAATPTWLWAHAALSDAAGWPSAVLLRDERLWLARGNRLFASVVGDFTDFSARDDTGLPQADLAISARISGGDAIRWMVSDRAILVGTSAAEHAVLPVNAASAIAFNNIQIQRQSSYGSEPVRPVQAGSSTLFVCRGGVKVRATDYAYERDKYLAPDATVKSEHITRSGIRAMAVQAEPESTVWMARGDGALACLTWSEEQDVRGWSRHIPGGDGRVRSLATIPSPDGGYDQLWLLVERAHGFTVERLAPFWREGQAQATGYFVDCGLTYEGPPVTLLSGLQHLAGETITVAVDGAAHPDVTVSAAGQVQLNYPGRVVHAGYAYPARVETMRIQTDVASGSGISKLKRVVKLGLGLSETLGIRVRRPGGRDETIPFRSSAAAMDAPPPLFSGEKIVGFPGTYDREARVIVESFQPLPFTLLSIGPRIDIAEGD